MVCSCMQLWLVTNVHLDESGDEKRTYIIFFNDISKQMKM
jgi:hypothetical protein